MPRSQAIKSLKNDREWPDTESDSEECDQLMPLEQEPSGNPGPIVLCDDDDSCDEDDLSPVDPDKPHSCRICRKGFKTKAHCKRHERTTHSDRKPYRCSECNARFKEKSNAVKHQAKHSDNPKPWLCPICKHTFSSKGSARRHVNRIHSFDLPDIPKIVKPKMAVIEKEANDDEADTFPRNSKKTTCKPFKSAKESKPPAGRIKNTPSTGQKRKRAQESAVDSVLGDFKPKDDPIRRQQVIQAMSAAVFDDKRKKRKQSVSSSHDSGFDEEYDSPTSKSPQAGAGRVLGLVESDDDARDFKFKFDYEIPVIAEVE